MHNGEPMPSTCLKPNKIRLPSADSMKRERNVVASFVDCGGVCSDGNRQPRATVAGAEASRRRPQGSDVRVGARAESILAADRTRSPPLYTPLHGGHHHHQRLRDWHKPPHASRIRRPWKPAPRHAAARRPRTTSSRPRSSSPPCSSSPAASRAAPQVGWRARPVLPRFS